MAQLKPSYVALSKDGEVTASHDPNRVQYMASTTKMVVFDYLLTLMDEGKLPPTFMQDNMRDAALMMYKSDNPSSRALVEKAREHLGGTGQTMSPDEFYRGLNSWVDGVIRDSGVAGHSNGRLTHIANSSGLDHTGNGGYFYDGKLNQTTALEMAILTRHHANAHDGKPTERYTKSDTFIEYARSHGIGHFRAGRPSGSFSGRGIYDNREAQAAGVDFVKTGTGTETDLGLSVGTKGRAHRVLSTEDGDVVALLAYNDGARVNARGIDLAKDGKAEDAPIRSGRGNILARTSTADVQRLAAIIYSESHTEKFIGQVAVGEVVLNRREKPRRYASTIKGVIEQTGQFEAEEIGTYADALGAIKARWGTLSGMAEGKEGPLPGNTQDIRYANAVIAARMALSGTSVVGNADHYLHVEVVKERNGGSLPLDWQRETARSGIKIGNHHFSTEHPGRRASTYRRPEGARYAAGLDVEGIENGGSWFARNKELLIGGGVVLAGLAFLSSMFGGGQQNGNAQQDSGGFLGPLVTMALIGAAGLFVWRQYDKDGFDRNVADPVRRLTAAKGDSSSEIAATAVMADAARKMQHLPKLNFADVNEARLSQVNLTGEPQKRQLG